jgi:hypothetical protein
MVQAVSNNVKKLFDMAMSYGIEICEEVLRRLIGKSGIETQLELSFDEIMVFQMDENANNLLRSFESELQELCEQIIKYNKTVLTTG